MTQEKYIETDIFDYIAEPQSRAQRKHIIIVNGCGGSGKDTFCEMLSHLAEVKHISVITTIKKIAKFFGWDGKKDDAGRKLLSDLKIAADAYNGFTWRELLDEIAAFAINPTLQILAVDMREKKQIQEMKERFNAKTVLVYNPRVQPINTNPADKNVMDIEYDYEILNDGSLQDLAQEAYEFLKKLEEDGK